MIPEVIPNTPPLFESAPVAEYAIKSLWQEWVDKRDLVTPDSTVDFTSNFALPLLVDFENDPSYLELQIAS